MPLLRLSCQCHSPRLAGRSGWHRHGHDRSYSPSPSLVLNLQVKHDILNTQDNLKKIKYWLYQAMLLDEWIEYRSNQSCAGGSNQVKVEQIKLCLNGSLQEEEQDTA